MTAIMLEGEKATYTPTGSPGMVKLTDNTGTATLPAIQLQ